MSDWWRRPHQPARWARPVLLVAVVCLPALLDVVWLYHFRFGYGTSWDESGYLARGLNDTHALLTGGPVQARVGVRAAEPRGAPRTAAFGSAHRRVRPRRLPRASAASAPRGPFDARDLRAGASSRELAVGSPRGVRRRNHARGHRLQPRVRIRGSGRHFFLTAALWALLSSDGLRNARWVWLAGAMAGLLVLTRTMTVSFLPALAVASLALLLGCPGRARAADDQSPRGRGDRGVRGRLVVPAQLAVGIRLPHVERLTAPRRASTGSGRRSSRCTSGRASSR